MRYQELLEAVDGGPLFETGLLLSGAVDANDLRRQLSRWSTAGKLIQLRRGLYSLPDLYAASRPHPFAIATGLVRGCYVSLQSALSYHGCIPESVVVTTCVTTGRPGTHSTPLGAFDYRHLSHSLWWGYQQTEVGPRQQAIIARPEKALLDLVHLTPGGDAPGFLRELRLAPDSIEPDRFAEMARRSRRPKLIRAANALAAINVTGNDDPLTPFRAS